MSASSSAAWQGAIDSVQYRVRLGTWTNWSRGSVLGATLTLRRSEGSLLIAFTAFFVGFVSSCFWRIVRVAMHRMCSTLEARDALHHQRQALLRNSTTATLSLLSFSLLGWAWHRGSGGGHSFRRMLPVDAKAPCPFKGRICRSNDSNLRLDTGYLDRQEHICINSAPDRRLSFRSVLTCAPLVTEGDSDDISTSHDNYTRYYYGPLWAGARRVNHTWQVENLASQYDRQADNPNIHSAAPNFLLKVFATQVVQRKNLLEQSNVMPIPDLVTPDGDMILLFLSGNGVRYFRRAPDPWYRGTVPGDSYRPHMKANKTFTTYRPEEAASPMACLLKYQFCNGTRHCGPLASFNDAAIEAAPHFNTSAAIFEGKSPEGAIANRFYWFFNTMSDGVRALHGLINSFQSNSLMSQLYFLHGLMGPIPDNQWQLDVTHWWATMLASIQTTFVTTAFGPLDPEVRELAQLPSNSDAQDMCNNQKIRSSDYTSFSLFGLLVCYILGAMVVIISVVLEPILSFSGRRRKYGIYSFMEWTANETLQLQRAAYQGLGSGTWSRLTRLIPKTLEGEMLADLPTHYTEKAQGEVIDKWKIVASSIDGGRVDPSSQAQNDPKLAMQTFISVSTDHAEEELRVAGSEEQAQRQERDLGPQEQQR